MNLGVIRTTTLAIGASLVGSVPGTLIAKLGVLPWVFLTVGILFLLHGTGFLHEYIVRRILRSLRRISPAVAIISDLPWTSGSPEKRTHIWAWSAMDPGNWQSKIAGQAKQSCPKAKVSHVSITRSWVRFFLDRYNVILNPYGSVYPEVNIKASPVLNTILDYVLNGGLFVNVADIPFYWAYDPQREVLYDVVKYTHQYVPLEYESNGQIYRLKSGDIRSFGPFPEAPFISEVKANIINTETIKNEEIEPSYYTLKPKDQSLGIGEIEAVAINRVVVIERHSEYKSTKPLETGRVDSLVEEIAGNGQALTPICYINFGKGKFLISLPFLDYDKQSEKAKEQVTDLQSALVVKELSGTGTRLGGNVIMEKTKSFLRNLFIGLSYGIVVLFTTGIILYIIRSDFGKIGDSVGFELATISAILGGLILTSGFLEKAPNSLQARLRQIGVAFIVATMSFAIYEISFASIAYTLAQYITALSITLGALSFAIGTLLLALVIPQLWSLPK